MIVGDYDLHLYCKNETLPVHFEINGPCPPGHHLYDEFPHMFMGPTERDAKAQARMFGWVFRSGDVICPRCSRANSKIRAMKGDGL